MKGVRAVEFDSDGLGNGKRSARCRKLKSIAAVALWIPSAQKSYVEVREEYLLDKATWSCSRLLRSMLLIGRESF